MLRYGDLVSSHALTMLINFTPKEHTDTASVISVANKDDPESRVDWTGARAPSLMCYVWCAHAWSKATVEFMTALMYHVTS